MAQTKEGALKVAAKVAGLTVEEYQCHCRNGLKRCTRCKEWKSQTEFFGDSTRSDGLNARCKECGRELQRKFPKGEGPKIRGKKRRTSYNKGQKLCGKCGQWKSPDDFESKKDAWDGRRSICRKCTNARKRASYIKKVGPRKGHTMTPAGRAAVAHSARIRMTGPNNPNWKGGTSTRTWRQAPEYYHWRLEVFKRDHFTCRDCGDDTGGNLTAHHVLPAENYPNLRYDTGNGLTLCETCHSKVHGIPVKGSRHKNEEMTICACGCGTSMRRWGSSKSTRPRHYLPGHFIKVLHQRQRKGAGNGIGKVQDFLV